MQAFSHTHVSSSISGMDCDKWDMLAHRTWSAARKMVYETGEIMWANLVAACHNLKKEQFNKCILILL